jgi:hypothetical protein
MKTTTEAQTAAVNKRIAPVPRVFVSAHGQLGYMPDVIALGGELGYRRPVSLKG